MFTFTTSAKSSPALLAHSTPLTPNESSILALSEATPTFFTDPQDLLPVDGTVTATSTREVRKVFINGIEYKRTFNEPQAGEFAIASATTAGLAERASTADDYQIKVNPLDSQTRYQVHVQSAVAEAVKTTNLAESIPDFMQTWNLIGVLTFSRSLEGHPTAKGLFQIPRSQECNARLQLFRGREVTLFGVALRITDYSYEPVQEELFQVRVSISFSGEHASYADPSRSKLDLPVRLAGKEGEKSGWQLLTDYAKEHNITYIGDPIYTYVPKTTSSEAIITVRDLLNRAIVNQQFMYYSAPGRIEARDWGKTKVHYLDDQWYKVISHRFPGAGALIGKVQLAKEYRNTELVLQKPEDVGDDTQKVTCRWEFKRAKSLAGVQTPAEPLSTGEDIWILKNPETDILRNPANAFDVGNFTKEAHYICEQGGTEISRETWIWGWIFNSLDTYSVIPKDTVISGNQNYGGSIAVSDNYRVIFTPFKKFSFIASAWQQVQHTKTVRKFDKEGYLIYEETTGKEPARSQQDDNNLSAIRAQLGAFELLLASQKATDADQIAELQQQAAIQFAFVDSYRYLKTEPIKRTVSYELQPHSKYFSDINNPTETQTFVEPRFMQHSVANELKRIVEENPASTSSAPLPPIIRGKVETQEQRVTITSRKDPGKFTTTDFSSNEEGNGLANKIIVDTPQENSGRPPIHQRKEIPEPTVPTEFTTGDNFTTQSLDINENKELKFLLNTPDSDPIENISQDTVSFPDVFDKELGKKVAETKISIDNTKSAEILEIETLYQDWQEGDRVIWEGKQYVILNLSYTITIDGVQRIKCNDYKVTLGRLIEPPVILTELNTNPNAAKADSPINGLQAIDGNVNYLNSIFNYITEATAASAIRTGLFESFLRDTGLLVLSPEEMSTTDGIEAFLGGIFGPTPNLALTSSGGSPLLVPGAEITIVANPPESGTLTDNRIKTPIEKFADLINRIAMLDRFSAKIEEILGGLLPELNNPALSGLDSNSDAAQAVTADSGGVVPLPSNVNFPVSAPNIILEGGDRGLENLMNALFNALAKLIQGLSKQNIDSEGGAGQAGSGAGPGGAGGLIAPGGGSSGVTLRIGELTILGDSFDFDGFIDLLLQMIAEANRLVNNFDLTPEEFLSKIIVGLSGRNGAANPASGGGSGGTGGGPSGFQFAGTTLVELIYPEGLEPATITIITPEEDLSTIDLDALFAGLDPLFENLANLASGAFGFDFDLRLLADQAGVATSVSADGGTSPFGGSNLDGVVDIGAGITFYPGDTNVLKLLVPVVDISGTVGGGVKPLPKLAFGSNFNDTSVFPNNGGLFSGPGNNAQTNSGNALSNPPLPAPIATTGDAGTSPVSSPNDPNQGASGTTGEFNTPGAPAANLPPVDPFPATNFAIASVTPINPGFLLPSTTVDETLANTVGQSISAPGNIPFDPLTGGSFLIVQPVVATEQVEWEIVSGNRGVEILTPFDTEPTIEFASNFDNTPVTLRAKLRKAPSITATVTILTALVSAVETGSFYTSGFSTISPDAKVDTTSFIPQAIFTNDESFVFIWAEPLHAAIAEVRQYIIQEQLPNGNWSTVSTVRTAQGNFLLNVTYRVLADYGNQLGGIPSDPFVLTTAPVLGQSIVRAGSFYTHGVDIVISPVPPSPFYTEQSTQNVESKVETGSFYTYGAGIVISPVPPSPFYTEQSTQNVESKVETGSFYTYGADIVISPVPPSPFYTI